LLILTLAGLGGCSKRQDDSSTPSGPAASVHPEGWTAPSVKANFHGQAIRSDGWNMSGCQSCHGTDYAGGSVDVSCLTCHPGTPEGCSVCHGSSANSAPPEDTQDQVETRFAGVGAHQAHVVEGALTSAYACEVCHTMPSTFADAPHIDGDGQAEIVWGGLAQRGDAMPQYDATTSTCAGVYCHSGGRFGNNPAIVWTSVGENAAACGTCHDLPPAEDTGHPAVPEGVSCLLCHRTVVDANLNLIDKSLHLNGATNATCATCHGLPPGGDHPQLINCSLCHGNVIDDNFDFVDESLHNNGEIDF